MPRFTNKYAVIIGAANGISKAATLLMTQQGLKGVIITGMNEELATKSASEIQGETGCVYHAVKVDVSKSDEIEALCQFTKDKFNHAHMDQWCRHLSRH